MNRKGDFSGTFWTVATLIFMVPFWAFFLGPQLAYWGHITALQTSGLEALFYDNLNFVFLIAMITFVLVGANYMGDS